MTDIDYQKILIDEPFPVYLANREKYLTSHQLMDFIRCPRLYYLKKTGALTTDPNKTSSEMRLGSAAHKLILEGREEFDRCHAVGAPINEIGEVPVIVDLKTCNDNNDQNSDDQK